ncbi:dihydrofolate reductase family protein [Nocardia yamanashiensis]|uniref:dihydrofolate reductase family protein n=1 Tax=Nocardia yamanashiensis TaxID=209247 RepID=UPI001E28BF7E|nr:dihydrofolate reductase family protein [Nocardia yamanashiensis]UGT38926.1 dihydrofolate reductase family protein [Nocardia yamanashiensis]
MNARRVAANISITLDGRYNGPGGAADLGRIVKYATAEVARNQMNRMWEHATTAVLGRGNAEGFIGYWSTVAADENADARDRGYAKWLIDTEKVVFSRTLADAPWDRARIVNGSVADIVADLKSGGAGDILVNTSPSILKPLLAADLVDRLYLVICPEIAGGGDRLFEDGLPGSEWTVVQQEIGELGEIAVVYDRVR